jgi:hypothetical protein
MIDTPEDAIAEIRRLKLPAVFLSVWGGTLPGVFRYFWQRPTTYLKICHDLAEYVPALAELCPLWEENGEAIVGCLPDQRFVEFYYEDAGVEDAEAAINVLGSNYQQFVTTILTQLEEADLSEYFDEIARLMNYGYTHELRALLDNYTDERGDADLARFREAIS